jgi:hypothetical protein
VSPAPTTPLSQDCPAPESWSAFHLGQLPEESLRRLSLHLELCPACSSHQIALENSEDVLIEELRRGPADDSYANELACRDALARLRTLVAPAFARTTTPRQFGPYLLRELREGGPGLREDAVRPANG